MTPRLIKVRSRLVRWGSTISHFLASSSGRLIVLLLTVAITGVVVYQTVWLPLDRAAELPTGVTPSNPELVVDVLQAINTQRAQRGQALRQNFGRYNGLFVPPPPTARSN